MSDMLLKYGDLVMPKVQSKEERSAIEALKNLRDNPSEKWKLARWATNDELMALYFLVQEHWVSTVIESGTANGFTATGMALAMRDIKRYEDFEVHTWDPYDRDKVWNWEPFTELTKDKHIIYHQDSFSADLHNKIEWIRRGRCYGDTLFFIDGDHSEEEFKKDWGVVKPLMAEGDIAVFHDAHHYKWITDTMQSIERFSECEYKNKWDDRISFDVSLLRTARGIGIVRATPYVEVDSY